MSVQYVVTPEEMQALLETLELKALRDKNHGPREEVPEHAKTPQQIHAALTEGVWRSFHFEVVRWAQSMGFNGYRK